MKTRPVEQRTCMCGRVLGNRSWYTRHSRTCPVYQASTKAQLICHTYRAFLPALVASITDESPFIRALMRNRNV